MTSTKTPKGTELPLMNIKGKPYLQVAHRLVWFREDHPDWTIKTDIERIEGNAAIGFAEIIDAKGTVIATAHKYEDSKGFPDFIEKAETGAIGRALALCGYGTQFAPEFDEESRLVDSPVQKLSENHTVTNVTTVKSAVPTCNICGAKMLKSRYDNGPEFYCPKYKDHKGAA